MQYPTLHPWMNSMRTYKLWSVVGFMMPTPRLAPVMSQASSSPPSSPWPPYLLPLVSIRHHNNSSTRIHNGRLTSTNQSSTRIQGRRGTWRSSTKKSFHSSRSSSTRSPNPKASKLQTRYLSISIPTTESLTAAGKILLAFAYRLRVLMIPSLALQILKSYPPLNPKTSIRMPTALGNMLLRLHVKNVLTFTKPH